MDRFGSFSSICIFIRGFSFIKVAPGTNRAKLKQSPDCIMNDIHLRVMQLCQIGSADFCCRLNWAGWVLEMEEIHSGKIGQLEWWIIIRVRSGFHHFFDTVAARKNRKNYDEFECSVHSQTMCILVTLSSKLLHWIAQLITLYFVWISQKIRARKLIHIKNIKYWAEWKFGIILQINLYWSQWKVDWIVLINSFKW